MRDLKKKENVTYASFHTPVTIPGKTTIESTWNKTKYPNMDMTWFTERGVIAAEQAEWNIIAVVPIANAALFTVTKDDSI